MLPFKFSAIVDEKSPKTHQKASNKNANFKLSKKGPPRSHNIAGGLRLCLETNSHFSSKFRRKPLGEGIHHCSDVARKTWLRERELPSVEFSVLESAFGPLFDQLVEIWGAKWQFNRKKNCHIII